MSQARLVTPAELSQYGLAPDYLSQFSVRSLVVRIEEGGALGTMRLSWRLVDDEDVRETLTSEDAGGSAWSYALPDPGFGVLTFAVGTYGYGAEYRVGGAGAVTPSGLLTATRTDLQGLACDSATSQAVTWMQPRVVPPVLSVGPGVKADLAALAIYYLKSRQGVTPNGAGMGDENLRLRAMDAEDHLKAIGRSDSRPPDLVDSSSNNQGGGIPLMPTSRSRRGFGDFS